MITVHNVHKTFQSGSAKVHALAGVSMEVTPGQLVAIIGKSGSGKSTLLALLGALDTPTSGEILVDGADVTKLHGHKLLAYRRSTIGFIFQNYNLVPNLSALENVMLPMEFAGKSSAARKKRATHLLSQVGLTGDKLHRTPGRLSGGEQQRVAIARALANEPKLVLADEPTGNLDSTTGLHIVELLRSLAKSEKTTVINVTHDTEIAKHADVTLRLHDGKLIDEHAR
jgi:putative ABC transport system ATP-binding protein